MKLAVVFLGLGSNLGDRRENIAQAIEALGKNGVVVLKTATFMETDAVGGPAQGRFLNTVIQGKTTLSPEQLLDIIHVIEQKLGRVHTVANGPRTMDIDILLYDDIKLSTPFLTIPHPRMFARDFVMIPLKEIAPHVVQGLRR